MTEKLKSFVESLRDELQNCGEMLVLLDQQAFPDLERSDKGVVDEEQALKVQWDALLKARQAREQRQKALAESVGIAEPATVTTLLPRLPEVYQPLVEALNLENQELMRQIEKRARQQHVTLNRALEMMPSF